MPATVAAARQLDTTVTAQGNTFNIASKLVQLTAAAKLPAVDGSLLTNLPSSADTFARTMALLGGFS